MDGLLFKNERQLKLICVGLKKYHGAQGTTLSDLIATAKNLTRDQTISLNNLLRSSKALSESENASDADRRMFMRECKNLALDIGCNEAPAARRFMTIAGLITGGGAIAIYMMGTMEQLKVFLLLSVLVFLPILICMTVYFNIKRLLKHLRSPAGGSTCRVDQFSRRSSKPFDDGLSNSDWMMTGAVNHSADSYKDFQGTID